MILALDLASRLTGWCAGDGSTTPTSDAFKLAQHGDDIGAMLVELDDNLQMLIARFRPSLIAFEAPILPSRGGKTVMGSTLTRRKLMNVAGHVEYMAARYGIPCVEGSVTDIKKELSGRHHGTKDEMVAAAIKVGVSLPEAEAAGRKDAADAFGLWLLTLRKTKSPHSLAWDRRLYAARGALL